MRIATKSSKINLSSEKKTEELALKFSKKLMAGNIVFLYGEIGVGKTTFIKYLIHAFQKKNNLELSEVTSPTFNLLNEYEINQVKIHHYDLFRLKSAEEVKNLNLFESYSKAITLIEWPQIIKEKPNDQVLSPAVRKIVAENKINLENIKGSGKDGRLLKGDLMSLMTKNPSPSELRVTPDPTFNVETVVTPAN